MMAHLMAGFLLRALLDRQEETFLHDLVNALFVASQKQPALGIGAEACGILAELVGVFALRKEMDAHQAHVVAVRERLLQPGHGRRGLGAAFLASAVEEVGHPYLAAQVLARDRPAAA